MAIPAASICEVEVSGSDTANAGFFNPNSGGMAADGAATLATSTAPVFTSASYNFAAGDVGAWLFIQSGTNWTRGWYPINSVAGGAATLGAGVGVAELAQPSATNFKPEGANTVAGCATVASPTAATWSVDYSQQSSPISLTSLTTAAANAIILTAAATVAMVGNGIQITAGTNFTAGVYVISSVSAGVSLTVDRNCATAAGSAGAAGVGGAFASPGMAGSVAVAGNIIFVKSGTYTISSATANVAGGCVSLTTSSGANCSKIIGYNTLRLDNGTRPLLQAGSISTFTIITLGSGNIANNVSVDGVSKTTSRGILANNATAIRCKAVNCTNSGIYEGGITLCEASGCSTNGAIAGSTNSSFSFCWSHDNTISGFGQCGLCLCCISSNNTTGTSRGFDDGFSANPTYINCTAYNNAGDGFRCNISGSVGFQYGNCYNCLSYGNGGFGFINTQVNDFTQLVNCAAGSNTSGATSGYGGGNTYNSNTPTYNSVISLTANPFVASGSNNYALNTTAGGGAACRAAGIDGTFPGGLTTGYADIGAVQHQDSGGGSGGLLVHPGMSGGMRA